MSISFHPKKSTPFRRKFSFLQLTGTRITTFQNASPLSNEDPSFLQWRKEFHFIDLSSNQPLNSSGHFVDKLLLFYRAWQTPTQRITTKLDGNNQPWVASAIMMGYLQKVLHYTSSSGKTTSFKVQINRQFQRQLVEKLRSSPL